MEAARLQNPSGSRTHGRCAPETTAGPATVIFGAGDTGKKLFRALTRRGHRIVAFADNDPALQDGGLVLGLPVLTPERLGAVDHDVIAVGSERFHEILFQLLELGFEESSILVPQRDLGLDLSSAPKRTYWELAFHVSVDIVVISIVISLCTALFSG